MCIVTTVVIESADGKEMALVKEKENTFAC